MNKIALLLTTICMLGMVTLFTACPDLKPEPKSEPKSEPKLESKPTPEPTPIIYTMISTAEDLQKINKHPTLNYALANDIDMEEYLKTNKWIPIGRRTPFSGIFDGKGYTIKNLKIDVSKTNNAGDNTGLFGKTRGATIKHLLIDQANIWGNEYVGALVGRTHTTTITAVGMLRSSNVSGRYIVGGLVGYARDSIVSGYTTGNVSGSLSVGGLVGYAQKDYTVKKNNTVSGYAQGNVSGDHWVGGLVGYMDSEGTVSGYARGTVGRKSGGKTTFGLLVGLVSRGSVTGYHSASTSESTFTGITQAQATGTDGTAIADITTVTNTNYKTTFGNLTFGTAVGTWKWMGNGKWSAINLPAFSGKGAAFATDQQPTDP